jgi:VanZ family protein
VQTVLTSLPGAALPPLPPTWGDLAVHAGLYGVLGVLVARAGRRSGWGWPRFVRAAAAVVIWAAVDELHQVLVPGRRADPRDWVADVVGAGVGLALGNLILTRTRASSWLA